MIVEYTKQSSAVKSSRPKSVVTLQSPSKLLPVRADDKAGSNDLSAKKKSSLVSDGHKARLTRGRLKNYQTIFIKNKIAKDEHQMANNIIEKEYDLEDDGWLRGFIDEHKKLNEINASTGYFKTKQTDELLNEFADSGSLSDDGWASASINRVNTRNSTGKRPTTTNHFDNQFTDSSTTSSFNLFPFSLPRSYTSMLNARYDRDEKELGKIFRQVNFADECSRIKTASSVRTSPLKSTKSGHIAHRKVDVYKTDLNERLESDKSIRRGLKVSLVKADDCVGRAERVEKKARAYRIYNYTQFQPDDPHIRYGSKPLAPSRFQLKKMLYVI